MPVRLLNSSVLKWPDQTQVANAVCAWIAEEATKHPELRRLGYFGSYTRGDWGVGSDLDLIAVVEATIEPFERRSLVWDLMPLPVPADLFVYTEEEWGRLASQRASFWRRVEREIIWIHPADRTQGRLAI